MVYKEEHRDLFSVPEEYFLAHCISADFALGAGIAVEFVKRYNMRNRLNDLFSGDAVNTWDANGNCGAPQGTCIRIDRVLNLVTKRNCWHKPTYEALKEALLSMRKICEGCCVQKIAMPLIGCGIDKLEWNKVSEILKETFEDTDMEILVCIL